jgi:hypothetical protein
MKYLTEPSLAPIERVAHPVKTVTGLQSRLSGVGPASRDSGRPRTSRRLHDVHAARPAELEPLGDKFAVLVEDLDWLF